MGMRERKTAKDSGRNRNAQESCWADEGVGASCGDVFTGPAASALLCSAPSLRGDVRHLPRL